MVSLLERRVRDQVAAAFHNRLLVGSLRRTSAAAVDSYGDPVPGAATEWAFDGVVDTFNAAFAARAGIPVTDVRVLIIAGSLATVPQKDDLVMLRDEWYQLRRLVERDPAGATYVFSGFQVEAPA